MPEASNASFPYPALREAERPKGGHLYRVFSLTNHAPMKFFYLEQLQAWTMLEFDPTVVSFESINRWFDHSTGSIYVGFYVRHIEYDRFLYIPSLERAASLQALEKYAKSFSVGLSAMGGEKYEQNDVLFWNRANILSVLVSAREKLSSRNIKNFVRSLKVDEATIYELEQMAEYGDHEALVYAFELVRTGRFSITSLSDELLHSMTVLRKIKSVQK